MQCSKCGSDRPATLEFFHSRGANRSGLTSQCKACRNTDARERDRRDPARTKAVRAASYKRHRKTRLAATKAWFDAHPGYATERYRQNPERGRATAAKFRARQKALGIKPELRTEYAAGWRARNREWLRDYFAKYRAENPVSWRAYSVNYKARKKEAAGKHTGEDIQRQLDAQGGKCHWCAKPLVKYHADHVIPLSRGGSNGPENIVIACPHCNISKGAKLPEEWKRTA